MKKHHEAADDLDDIRDEHDPALRHRVGESADEGREHHVGDREEELQQRRHPLRRLHLQEQRDRGDEQRIVRERREKLRRHDDVKTEGHQQEKQENTGAAQGRRVYTIITVRSR